MYTWKKESGEFLTLLAFLGQWGDHNLPPPQGKENFGQGKLPWDGRAAGCRTAGGVRSGVTSCWRRQERKWRVVFPFLTVFASTYVALCHKNKCCSLEKHIIVWVVEVTGCNSRQGKWIHVVTKSINSSWQLPLKSEGAKGPQNLTGVRHQGSSEGGRGRRISRKDSLGQCSFTSGALSISRYSSVNKV